MTYLDYNAADTYLTLALRSYDLRLIDRWGLEQRLACLKDMLDPNDPLHDRLEQQAGAQFETQWPAEDEGETFVTLARVGSAKRQRTSASQVVPPLVIHLVVRSVVGMKRWVFHEYDEDPFPSVPHGHENGKKNPKCDPYTGRVYDSHRNEIQRDRLARRTLVELWQHDKFREFALKSIIWYEEAHPFYTFRVNHPRRLPRFK